MSLLGGLRSLFLRRRQFAFDAAVRKACRGETAARAQVTEAMARQVWHILRANGWGPEQAMAQAATFINLALGSAARVPSTFSTELWSAISEIDPTEARIAYARDVFQRQFLFDLPSDLRWFQESILRDESDAEFEASLVQRRLSIEAWENGVRKAREALRALMLSVRDDDLRKRTFDYWSHSSANELLG